EDFRRNRVRGLTVGLMVTGLLTIATVVQPMPVAATDPDQELTATLDGKPIPLEDVSKYSCDDFSYPEIRCSSTRVLQDARATLVTLLTSIDYVTIYDFTNFGGASMNVSQDYATLATIGWTDKISYFRARNDE